MKIPVRNRRPGDNSDLGFGSIVSKESRHRLVNKDGTFNVKRKGLNYFASLSLYHSILTMTWSKFILLIIFSYIFVNTAFAIIYVSLGHEALLSSNIDNTGLFSSVIFLQRANFGNNWLWLY